MPFIASIGEILFDVYENEKKIGGAPFNFIYHVIKLTGRGNFVSRIGNDEFGAEILNFLKHNGISSDYIQTDDTYPTGRAIANLDEKKIPHWKIEQNCAYDFIKKKEDIVSMILNSDCLYFGTLAQRSTVSRDTIQSLLGKPIKYFCDLNIRQNYFTVETVKQSLKTADVLKINEDELIILNNLFINETYDLIATSLKIKNLFAIDLLCVTCGEKGSYLFKLDEIDFCKASVKDAIDTVGAGDAYASILCTGYLGGWNLKDLNKTAADFAGEIVKIRGALPENDNIYDKFKIKV